MFWVAHTHTRSLRFCYESNEISYVTRSGIVVERLRYDRRRWKKLIHTHLVLCLRFYWSKLWKLRKDASVHRRWLPFWVATTDIKQRHTAIAPGRVRIVKQTNERAVARRAGNLKLPKKQRLFSGVFYLKKNLTGRVVVWCVLCLRWQLCTLLNINKFTCST